MSAGVIATATAIAEQRDLMKDSFTSNEDLMSDVDELRRDELEKLGLNPYVPLPVLSKSTTQRIVKLITPVTVTNGSVQNTARRRALQDARNAISCAACWKAITEGIVDGKFVHSWDECGVMLNAFNEKRKVKCTVAGRRKLAEKNLAPATTEIQQERRMLKLGLSKFRIQFFSNVVYYIKSQPFYANSNLDTNGYGILECAIAMIFDDNFVNCRHFKVFRMFFLCDIEVINFSKFKNQIPS